jgi:hypothetical protein
MTLIEDIRIDAEAIEHALHDGILADLGLLPDAQVTAAIAAVASQARLLPGGLALLLAGDYFDDPGAFVRRMNNALYRAAQIRGSEDLYPQLRLRQPPPARGHAAQTNAAPDGGEIDE